MPYLLKSLMLEVTCSAAGFWRPEAFSEAPPALTCLQRSITSDPNISVNSCVILLSITRLANTFAPVLGSVLVWSRVGMLQNQTSKDDLLE